MPIRPGDSAPKFDSIPDPHEGPQFPSAPMPQAKRTPPAGASRDDRSANALYDDEPPVPEALTMPAFVPHQSDGSTAVYQRGRDLPGSDPVADPGFQTVAIDEPSPGPAAEFASEPPDATASREVTANDRTEPFLPRVTGTASVERSSLDVTLELRPSTFLPSPVLPAEPPPEPKVATAQPSLGVQTVDATSASAETRPAEFTAVEAPVAEITPQFSRPAKSSSATSGATTSRNKNSPEPKTVTPAPRPQSSLLLVLLFSYASAVTIALIYLLATRGSAEPSRHQLEDLRDPADEEGVVRIIQRGVDLPPGHTLNLAQARRFGNIVVEPLRVTRGPVEFEHFSGAPNKRQAPSPPVYKLWLRLTNASTDQEIAPLDALLLYKRVLNDRGDLVSNAFLARSSDVAAGPVVFTYPLSTTSEWDMRGQDLGRRLKPGESMETFIPSDVEGLSELAGDLLWRFQLRKGYAPTGRGVTTLVQVAFSESQVEQEAAPPAAPGPAGKSPPPLPARS